MKFTTWAAGQMLSSNRAGGLSHHGEPAAFLLCFGRARRPCLFSGDGTFCEAQVGPEIIHDCTNCFQMRYILNGFQGIVFIVFSLLREQSFQFLFNDGQVCYDSPRIPYVFSFSLRACPRVLFKIE